MREDLEEGFQHHHVDKHGPNLPRSFVHGEEPYYIQRDQKVNERSEPRIASRNTANDGFDGVEVIGGVSDTILHLADTILHHVELVAEFFHLDRLVPQKFLLLDDLIDQMVVLFHQILELLGHGARGLGQEEGRLLLPSGHQLICKADAE